MDTEYKHIDLSIYYVCWKPDPSELVQLLRLLAYQLLFVLFFGQQYDFVPLTRFEYLLHFVWKGFVGALTTP
jgi:hypothetical protein